MNIKRQEKVIVIIPALNEEGKIGRVISRINLEAHRWVDEILVIDDGSRDNTLLEAKNKGATLISHDSKRGVGAAIRSGVDYALSRKYDIVVVISGDDQHVPSEMERVVLPIVNEGYDFVQGSRRLDGKRYKNITLFRRVTTSLFALIFRLFTAFPATDATNGFRAFKTEIFKDKKINIWQTWLDTYELEPYLYYKAVTGKLRVKEVPITIIYHSKIGGWTKMKPFIDWWRIIRPLIYLKLGLRK